MRSLLGGGILLQRIQSTIVLRKRTNLHLPEIEFPSRSSLVCIVNFYFDPYSLQNFSDRWCSIKNSCFLIILLPNRDNYHLTSAMQLKRQESSQQERKLKRLELLNISHTRHVTPNITQDRHMDTLKSETYWLWLGKTESNPQLLVSRIYKWT